MLRAKPNRPHPYTTLLRLDGTTPGRPKSERECGLDRASSGMTLGAADASRGVVSFTEGLRYSPMTGPYFYSVAQIRGTGIMVALFEVDDPYSLPPSEIVEKLLALGHVPIIEHMRRESFPQYGRVSRVMRDEQCFLVAVSRDAQLISVQEIRFDPYPPR